MLKMMFYLLIPLIYVGHVYGGALVLSQQNFDSVLSNHELVFVNYYANWCRFSQMLEPIYDEFADKLANEISPDKVAIGKVDCDVETQIATNNQINKYPTIKLYRYGTPTKKEYRGARSVEGFISFIKEQLANPVKVVKSPGEYSASLAEVKKRMIVGFFSNEETESYKLFLKLSSILRDTCSFIANIGMSETEKITFRENVDQSELVYGGDLNNYDAIYAWTNERCISIVREITFENAEELTEEGLPFLILFHKPDDHESVKTFEKEVKRQLPHLRHTINPVYADGYKFSHPLHHLGKTANDLPLLAIDSFRHMYLFSDYRKLTEGTELLQFVMDLHSGKLHREFHNGPDPTTEAAKIQVDFNPNHVPKIPDNSNDKKQLGSTPPESVFIKLAPSRDRYTLKTDGEL